jgi:hypothetical protein
MTATSTLWRGLAVLAASSLSGWAASPDYINYQGRLNGADGNPLPTGSYTIEFNIYDQANLGTRVWGPFRFDGQVGDGHGSLVPVVNGRFNVIIGPRDTSSRSIQGAFTGTDRFVEIAVNGGSPILPRQQFLSAPYAMRSQSAQEALIAHSLIEELANALCPPGSILAFGGNTVPSGWLLCDGRPVASSAYPDLFLAVGQAWGNGTIATDGHPENPDDPGTDFNLPDLRGMFLRGANLARADGFQDPDAGNRVSVTGGSTGNLVGSLQTNALQNVTGDIGDFNTYAAIKGTSTGPFNRTPLGNNTGIGSGSSDPYTRVTMNLSFSARTSTETRPNNAAVNYIIKY